MTTPRPSLDIADLVEQHAPLLYGLARRLSGCSADAEDLVQQTFLAAQSHGDQLRDTKRVRAWLCTILRNEFLKLLRQRGRSRVVSIDVIGDVSSVAPTESPFDSEALQQALDALPGEFRLPLVMYYFEDLNYREIASELDVPIGTVMSRLSRGKARLRERLESQFSTTRSAHTMSTSP